MGDYIKGMFAANDEAEAGDSDFADFAGAPDPVPPSHAGARPALAEKVLGLSFFTSGTPLDRGPVAYTKWYRVWERASLADFQQEMYLLPFIFVVVAMHAWGRRKNRRMARSWITAHAPVMAEEFAVVGFSDTFPKFPAIDNDEEEAEMKKEVTTQAELLAINDPMSLVREATAMEFNTYATGRANTAFIDVKMTMIKRYNIMTFLLESLISSLFESFRPPMDKVEIVSYAFDGHEKEVVPVENAVEQDYLEKHTKANSSYDGFVWGVVHKEYMKMLREDRYDLSLTFTRDNPKLPNWCAVMTEASEITDTLLTAELIKLIEQAGQDNFISLIVSDQPLDKPSKVNETIPRKRAFLTLALPGRTRPDAYAPTQPLFKHFLRWQDKLVAAAHFRPEVLKKVRAVREDEVRKIVRLTEDERAEERKAEADKRKKEARDARLKGLSAEEQRKVLDKEREKEQRRAGRKMKVKA